MLQRFLTPPEVSPGLRCDGHLLIVTPGFPATEQDSSCFPPVQVALTRIRRDRPDLKISVISMHYPAQAGTYQWNGVEVIALGVRGRIWPLRIVDLVRGVVAARRLHSSQPVDAVHALWLTDAAVLACLIVRRLNLPLTATIMGQDALKSNRYLRLLPISRIRLAAVSDRASATFLSATHQQPDIVIPWGLDAHKAEPAHWSQRPIHVLGVGSLTANKDFSLLLQICQKLAADGRHCRAVLVGDGPERTALEARARRLGLAEILVFDGHRPRPEVLQRMAQARILVHPARYEGFGFVFSEALAHGMSVVSRPVGAATAGPRWRLCESEEQFVICCRDLLDHPPGTEAVELYPTHETVSAYTHLLGVGSKN